MTDIESAWIRYPDYRIDLVACRGTVRVRVAGQVLAESTNALRLIETDHLERLYFPKGDVRLDALTANEHTSVCPFKGRASYWSHPEVENLFWTYLEPFGEVAGIEGFLGVWHDKDGVAVEVESAWPDGAKATVRFPGWEDQDDLTRLLDPQPSGPARFSAPGYHVRERNVVEGGQLVGQAIVAASRTCPDKRVSWVSSVFARAAGFQEPIDLEVEVLREGRTFSTVEVRSSQSGRLVTPSIALLDAGAADIVRHVTPPPDVPGPTDSEPFDMGVVGRDIRVVDGAYSGDPGRNGPPELRVWIRFRDNPDERCLRQALIAQASTHWTIAAAMRPHDGLGEDRAHTELSTGPVAISIAFHEDVPVDQWLLYSTTATSAGLGMTYGDSRVLTEDGTAVASYSLQAMVRGLLPGAIGKDPSEAM